MKPIFSLKKTIKLTFPKQKMLYYDNCFDLNYAFHLVTVIIVPPYGLAPHDKKNSSLNYLSFSKLQYPHLLGRKILDMTKSLKQILQKKVSSTFLTNAYIC